MSDSPVAIVTGGAQGIGVAICKELLKKGYRICVADIQESKAEEVAREQQSTYGEENVIAVRCDVTKESDYAKLFEQTLKHFKRVDVLVNNAGILLEADPRKTIEVNLVGPLFGCHAALKYMGKSNGGNGGVVINTASVAGVVPVAILPAYVASKHGVVGLTRSFGLPYHYDKDGILFAALCPYYVDTDMMKSKNKTLIPELDSSGRTDKMRNIFNHFHNEHARTNNNVKGFHSKINKRARHPHQNIYSFIELIRTLQLENEGIMRMLLSGSATAPKTKTKYRWVNEILIALKNKFRSNNIALMSYVDPVGHLLHLENVEYTAKGVLKLLEDKINGSTLLVVPDGYHYYELDEKLKILIPADDEL